MSTQLSLLDWPYARVFRLPGELFRVIIYDCNHQEIVRYSNLESKENADKKIKEFMSNWCNVR